MSYWFDGIYNAFKKLVNTIINNTNVQTTEQLPIATKDQLGVIKQGNNIVIDPDGTINAVNGSQVQTDWNEADNTKPDYLKNKPVNLSSFINDEGFITDITGLIAAGSNVTITGSGTAVSPYVINAVAGALAATCMPKAKDLGILSNGLDQTGAINTALANANYSGIIFDYSAPGAVTITGTVVANNKLLLFFPGNSLTGGGTVQNACINGLTYYQKILDTTITLSNCFTAGSRWSAKWQGVTGDGVTDDYPFLQAAADMVIANTRMPRTLYVPTGNCKTSAPVIFYSFSGGEYRQIDINFLSEENIESSPNSSNARILPTFTDSPAIIFQFANGGYIKGFSIENVPVVNSGLWPSQSAFYLSNWSVVAPTSRNSQYSPNAGICVDAFSGATAVPPDGGYPGLNGSGGGTNWYRGTAVRTGSTDFHVYQCRVQGFTVDIMFSPNGYTQQQEDCGVHNCDLNYCNVGVGWGNTQSDHSMIEDTRAWYYIYNVFDTTTYGNTGVGATIGRIIGTNIAGVVKNLFNINISQKSLWISGAYCENLYSIGSLYSAHDEIILDACHFNFAYLPIRPQYHGTFHDVSITGCTFKYFDDLYDKRCWFSDGYQTKFKNCFFDQPPLIVNPYNTAYPATFEYCQSFDPTIGRVCQIGAKNESVPLSTNTAVPLAYGKFSIQDFYGLDDSTHPTNSNQCIPDATATYSYDCPTFNRYLRNFAVSVTITPDPTLNTASFTCAFPNQCRLHDYILDAATGFVVGRITNIVSSTITISEIPDNIAAGTYTLDLVYYITVSRPFLGDIANTSATVSNIVPVFNAPYVTVGDRIDHPAFPLGTYISSYDNSTRQAVFSMPSNVTATRQNFANGNPQPTVRATRPPTDAAYGSFVFGLLQGTTWIELVNTHSSSVSVPTTWFFTKGGTLNSGSYYAGGGTNKADFNISPPLRVVAGNIQAYDTYADTWSNV